MSASNKTRLKVSDQFKYWRMKSGEEIRIDVMDDFHLINSVKMCRRAIASERMVMEEMCEPDLSDEEIIKMISDDVRIQEYQDLMDEVRKRCLTHCL